MEKERSQRILFQFDDFKQAICQHFEFKVTIKPGYFFGKSEYMCQVYLKKAKKLSELEG